MRLREYFRHYKDVHRNNFYKSLLGIMSPGLRGEVSVEMNSVLAEGIGYALLCSARCEQRSSPG